VSVANRTRPDLSWILALLLAVLAVAPLTYPGFLRAQSGFLPAFNVQHLADAPNWGRLADAVRGEGKLPYLLAWPFFQGSGSGTTAIKWGYALSFLLGALGVYAWTRPWLSSKGAVLAAAVYTYLPWHLSTVYERGAYAEAWLWAFWPFVLWAIDQWQGMRPGRILVVTAAGLVVLGATFWTQPGLAVLAVPLLVAYSLIVPARKSRPVLLIVVPLALLLLLGWLVASRLPVARTPFAEHFLYPFQLLSAAWGKGPSFQLGLAGVGLSIVSVALWISRRGEPKGNGEGTEGDASAPELPRPAALAFDRAFWFLGGTLLVLVLLTLGISAWLWRISRFDLFLTYPWQLLALTGLPLAFLSGAVIRWDGRLATWPAWTGLAALVVLASYPYLAPKFTRLDPGAEPVAMFQPVGADAPQLMLLDYQADLATEITPTLTLTLTWQAVEPVAEDYTVFVHALAAGDTKVAQRDTRPCDGECPTNTWQAGEIIVDRHQLALPPNAPPGPYRLAVGLYLLDTGDRAIVVGREDRTVLIDVP
jgi:hypothetical protein